MEKCANPFNAYLTGYKTKNGKDEYYLDLERLSENNKLLVTRNIKVNPYDHRNYKIIDGKAYLTNSVKVPCGKCLGCQINKASEWATRLYYEAKQHKYYYFTTLTYNDQALKEKRDFKRDIQLFLKRLRKNTGLEDIKYFANFEKGEKTKREHWHLIIYFNKEFKDNLIWLKKEGENNYYTSGMIQKCWKLGYDVTTISTKPDGTLKYVSAYVCKKSGSDLGIHLQSKELGNIEDKNILKSSYVLVEGKRKKIPKYVKEKIQQRNDIMYKEIQQQARKYIMNQYEREDWRNDLTKEKYAQQITLETLENYQNKAKKRL